MKREETVKRDPRGAPPSFWKYLLVSTCIYILVSTIYHLSNNTQSCFVLNFKCIQTEDEDN